MQPIGSLSPLSAEQLRHITGGSDPKTPPPPPRDPQSGLPTGRRMHKPF